MKVTLIAALIAGLTGTAALAQNNQPDWSFTINVPAQQGYQVQHQNNVPPVPSMAQAMPKGVPIPVPTPVQKPVIQPLPPIPQANDWQERDRQWRDRDNYRTRLLENNQRVGQVINDRQDKQLDRIVEGVRTGRLSRDQFSALMANQKHLREVERSYLADSFWAKEEFDSMVQLLDDEDRVIRRVVMGRSYRGN